MVCVWVPNLHEEMDQNVYCGETRSKLIRPRLMRLKRSCLLTLVKSWVVVYLFSNLGLVSWRWFRGHLGDKG